MTEKIEEYTPYEQVDHPAHYNQGIEAIKVIESHKLNFNLGNVIKYVLRAEHKGRPVEDLRKAEWYLKREIDRRLHCD